MDETLPLDQAFIKKLTDTIQDNLKNEQFGVEELSRQMGMSHSTIHRKLESYTHRSVSRYIREIRLQKAHEMLQQNLGTISDISFRVGFGSPAYFDKCFHEYFGFPPSEIRKRWQNERAGPDETLKENRTGRDLSGPETERASPRRNDSRWKWIILILAAAIIVTAITIILVSYYDSDRPSKDLSVIVLPFKNLSDDPGNQYFSDALMEDILNSLYQISDLRVISRTTSEHFRGTNITTREIAKEVNSHYALEGSIRRQGEMIRVNIQLIDAIQDKHVWSATFDRNVFDMPGIQSEIALNVARKLNISLTEEQVRRIKADPALNPGAIE